MEELTLLPVVQIDAAAGYKEFRALLDKAKLDNANRVFQYEDPKGNKEARSHVFSLRKIKGQVEKRRVELKAQALEYGRKVDGYAKDLTAEVEEMIQVHEVPLLLIENRETERKAAIQARFNAMAAAGAMCDTDTSSELAAKLVAVRAIEPSKADFQERAAEAESARAALILALETREATVLQREADAAELARLRAEADERARQEREAEVARKAKEEAERKAAEEAERVRLAAEAREKALKDEAARVEREAKERETKAEADRLEYERKAAEDRKRLEDEAAAAIARAESAAKAERDRLKREADEAAAKQERERLEREANAAHVAQVNRAAIDALLPICGTCAADVVAAIAAGSVPAVRIDY